MSCNGCRILRKGCSQDCTLRPCLQWLANPQYQSNATFFLAKFYGRAGLINLINAGPHHLRPAIFRSLLYEACGRIVDPVYGSAGLLCSGSWHLCQAAVEAVLKGLPIEQLSPSGSSGPPMMKSCDIRHVSKEERSGEVHKINHRGRFKRSVLPKQRLGSAIDFITASKVKEITEVGFVVGDMAEASSRSRAEDGGVRLELSLGLEPVPHASRMAAAGHVQVLMRDKDRWDDSTCQLRLGLHLPP